MPESALLRGQEARDRLREARLCLLFTPELLPGGSPMAALEAALPHIDVLQIRPKALGSRAGGEARATHDWTLAVIDLIRASGSQVTLVLTVNDRVDVAMALASKGVAGVHLGQDDMPAARARELLGEDALLGLSTHTLEQVGAAIEAPIDYLGFGPVHATGTKGYSAGLGSELAWIAASSSPLPLFPIGGIDSTNAGELSRIGRAAVSSAILCACDPAHTARELRALLSASSQGRSSIASP